MGNEHAFAQLVIELLRYDVLYQRVKNEALEYSIKWDWDAKSKEILEDMRRLLV